MARVLGDEAAGAAAGRSSSSSKPAAAVSAAPSSKTTTGRIIDSVAKEAKAAAMTGERPQIQQRPASSLVAFAPPPPTSSSVPSTSAPSSSSFDQLARRMPAKWPRPKWHPHWRCYRVVSGHLGWVRSLAVDPVSNEWFASGSADRTIKIWVRVFFFHFFFSVREKRKTKTHPLFFPSLSLLDPLSALPKPTGPRHGQAPPHPHGTHRASHRPRRLGQAPLSVFLFLGQGGQMLGPGSEQSGSQLPRTPERGLLRGLAPGARRPGLRGQG